MSTHTATVHWQRDGHTLPDGQYTTGHAWHFDGGAEIPASASTHVMDPPRSVAEYVDPEEALVAAASSCHMLFFLFFADRAGFAVADYQDKAEGTMAWNEEGRMAITEIRLHPRIRYQGTAPDPETQAALHEKSHKACFIANSLNARIETIPES